MKTLISDYQQIKERLKSQLEDVEKTEQVVQIVQAEINQLADLSGDYIKGLTPPQARLATVMLKALNQYTSILMSVKLPESTAQFPEKSNTQEDLTKLTSSPPFSNIIQIDKNIKTLTSVDSYKQVFVKQVQNNSAVISSLVTGGIAGTLAGGESWGLIGAITGGLLGKIIQQIGSENTNVTSSVIPPKIELKIDINKLLDHLYQAFQSIDLIVATYGTRDGTREEKASKPGLENHLDLLEYLQDLMADALDKDTQLPTAVRRRIEQAVTLLRRYGIETRVYQPQQEQNLGIEPWSMFYFEPSLDPNVTDYLTLKHAFVKDDQVILPGSVVEPAASEKPNSN